MQKQIISVVKCFIILFVCSFIFSCKKEHLQPEIPPTSGNTGPLVFISANLDGDSVYYAGGINNYVGIPSMIDTLTNFRMFNFSIQNSQLPSQSYFKISINNYQNVLGNPQADLDSSIYFGSRSYMPSGGVIFTPRAVQVFWFNAAGIQFKSTTATPNSFSITSVTDTIVDSKNYKKATLKFECYLQGSGLTIHLINGNATALFAAD